MSFPYVQSPDRLAEFLRKLPTVGVPQRLNNDFLKSLGYTSSNDRAFSGVVKAIGLTDGSGNPTDLWKEARTGPGSALAKGIRAGYGSLYQTYPNAHQQSNEAVKNFFKANSSVGDAAVSKMVSTFKALTGMASFDLADAEINKHDNNRNEGRSPELVTVKPQLSSGVNLSLNIQLQVPSDPTGEVYDKFFAAMKKHLNLG